MVQILPYLLPLMLGRTFDLNKMTVGVDIFPKEVLENTTVIQVSGTSTLYHIVEHSGQARKLLHANSAFSLKVKTGNLKGSIAGEYLSENYDRSTTVEVMAISKTNTVVEMLPFDAQPIPNWQKYGEALGTHYVGRITYGGERISSIRFKAKRRSDKDKIKIALENVRGMFKLFESGLQVESERMKNVSNLIESTQIKIFSPIPVSAPSNNMDDMEKIEKEYSKTFRLYNKGKGVPLTVELFPLTSLDSSRKEYEENRTLEMKLEYFEEKLDDLLDTKAAILNWMKVLKKPLTKEQEEKVGALYKETENAIKVFYDVVGELDMSQGTDQLKKAEEAYGGKFRGIFYRKYMRLRQKIDEQ